MQAQGKPGNTQKGRKPDDKDNEIRPSAASEIFDRGTAADDVSQIVSEIIEDVAKNGDAALKKYCAKFDGFNELMPLEVSADEWASAMESVDKELIP